MSAYEIKLSCGCGAQLIAGTPYESSLAAARDAFLKAHEPCVSQRNDSQAVKKLLGQKGES